MTLPPLAPDFADLFACLNEAKADYMVVGGYAVMAHGHIRATRDLDIWVRPTRANARRVLAALEEFGMPPGLSLDVLAEIDGPPPTGFRFGRPPMAVDLLTSIRGVDFNTAWKDSLVRDIGGLSIRLIGLTALLQNKRSTERAKDMLDVEALRRIAGIDDET